MTSAGRVPPHDLEAEAAVLESVMARGTVHDVAEVLRAEDFYSDANRAIYEAALALANASRPTDMLAVSAWLRERGQLQSVGGVTYLTQIVSETPAHFDVMACAQVVVARARVRRMIAIGHRVAAEGYADIGETQEWLDGVERDVFAVAQTAEATQAVLVNDVLRSAYGKIQDAIERGDRITGIPSGLDALDVQLGGFQRGDVTILAARPGMGKTALAVGAALSAATSHVWDAKVKVNRQQAAAIFSLEMPRDQLGARMIYSEAGVNSAKLRHGVRFTREEMNEITGVTQHISQFPLWIDDKPGIKPIELRARVRRIRSIAERKKVQLGLVVVDYLQLMNGRDLVGKNASRENEVTAISKAVKEIAKECDVHMLVLSQLNRAVETRKDNRPMLSDLRESGSIEQDADNVLFIYREEYYAPDKQEAKGKAEIIIAKQRNGPTGVATVAFRGDCVRFDNLAQDWRNEGAA